MKSDRGLGSRSEISLHRVNLRRIEDTLARLIHDDFTFHRDVCVVVYPCAGMLSLAHIHHV